MLGASCSSTSSWGAGWLVLQHLLYCCNVSSDVQVAVPDSVEDYAAAQFLINPVTAYGFLEAIDVPQGEWLLQNAANSVLGKEVRLWSCEVALQSMLTRVHEQQAMPWADGSLSSMHSQVCCVKICS